MRILTIVATALAAFLFAPLADSSAATLNVLHSFCKKTNCTDGEDPLTPLTADLSGNLYGTTYYGGVTNFGTIYALFKGGDGSWTYQRLHNFCAKANCADGSRPDGPLIVDTAGSLYGMTSEGGPANTGVVFGLMPNADRTKWKLHVLHKFCDAFATDCHDGSFPAQGVGLTYAGAASGALYDGTSPLYGTTDSSSADNSHAGIAFQLTPVLGTDKWKEKIIYSFCSQSNCADGDTPLTGLTPDGADNLFGTTGGGGANAKGTIFQLSHQGHSWTHLVLYSFCALANCADGTGSGSRLFRDASGNLYGTSQFGGPNCVDQSGCGVAYKLIPNGAQSQYSVLYAFCSQTNCADGKYPFELSMDAQGNLFGTTGAGGNANNGGVLFELNDTYHVLYTFCSQVNCADGTSPSGGVLVGPDGDLVGTTYHGGAHAKGIVYDFAP